MSIANLAVPNSYNVCCNNFQVNNVIKSIANITSFATTSTLTAANMLCGIIDLTTPSGGEQLTLPSAPSVIALIPNPTIGLVFQLVVRNLSSTSYTFVLGSGWTQTSVSGSQTFVANACTVAYCQITGAATMS